MVHGVKLPEAYLSDIICLLAQHLLLITPLLYSRSFIADGYCRSRADQSKNQHRMKKISLLCLLGLLSGLLTPIAAQNTTSPGLESSLPYLMDIKYIRELSRCKKSGTGIPT